MDSRSAAGVQRLASLSPIGEQGEQWIPGASQEPPEFSHVGYRRPGDQPLFEDDGSPEVRGPRGSAYVNTGRYHSPEEP